MHISHIIDVVYHCIYRFMYWPWQSTYYIVMNIVILTLHIVMNEIVRKIAYNPINEIMK